MNGPGFHFNRNLVLPVDRVEVRHTMLMVEHADYDAEKSRQFGHGFLNGQRLAVRQAATMVDCGMVLPACPLDLKLDSAVLTARFWN